MAFPNEPSNFRTGPGPNAYWFVVSPDGSRRVCQISGLLFIRMFQDLLRQRVPANTPTYAGGTVSGASVQIDGRVGPTTMKALYALLVQLGAPESMRGEVASEGAYPTPPTDLSRGTVTAMIWAWKHSNPTPLPDVEIELPPDAVMPLWNTAPAAGTTRITCDLMSAPAGADTTPPAPGEPEPPPPAPGDTWVPPKTGETWGKDIPVGGGQKSIEKIVEGLNTVGTVGTKDPLTLALERPISNLPSTPPNAGMSTTTKIVIGTLVVAVLGVLAATKGPAVIARRRARARKNPAHMDDWLGEAFAA